MIARTKWLIALAITMCGTIDAADEPKREAPAAGLAVGELLPAFESTDEEGLPWKSIDHVGKKVLVLYFYPDDFTGGCIKQVEAYCEGLANLEELTLKCFATDTNACAGYFTARCTTFNRFGRPEKHLLPRNTQRGLRP